jgi:autotransporter-associated beta strand protein
MNNAIHAVTLEVARRLPRSAAIRLSLTVFAAAVLPLAAHAQVTVTWDGGGDMTWTQPDSTSWSGATYQSGDTALFAGAGPGTVTISGTVTPGQVNVTDGSYTLSGVIGGSGGIAKSGGGTLTLAGSVANTYAGITAVSGGTLSLNKSSGIVAVPGDLTVSGSGTRVSLPSNLDGQIGDTAAVTMNATGGVFNGTVFGATTNARTITDTIRSLTVSAGQFNTGADSVWTVSGAGIVEATGSSPDTRFTAFSGSSISFESLTIQGMNDETNNAFANRGFFVAGSSPTTQTTVAVGDGGLTLDASVLKLGGSASNTGSRLVLDGDVTVSGSAGSRISRTTSGGGSVTAPTVVQLSGTSGLIIRTFTVADATSSADPDLTVTASITDGAATAATLAKAGPGTMLLTASNTYNGDTTINAGTLQIGNGGTTGSILGNVANDGTLAFNRSNQVIFTGTISGSGGLVQDGAGELILEADNTFTGPTVVNSGTLTIGNLGTTGMVSGDIVNAATLIFRRSDAAIYSGAISGSGALLKSGSNTLVLAGSTGNTFTGPTSISGGQLQLDKSSGNAIGGDLTISGNSSLTFLQSNQIADTAVVQVTGGNFNGTGPNTGLANILETIGQLHVSGSSSFSTSMGGSWTITGAMSFTGGSGATFVGSSGSTLTVGSLSLSDVPAVAGSFVSRANSFTVYGNATTLTTLSVGSGGLALENSRLNLRGGQSGRQGSRLVLDGGVTVTGSAASLIAEDTAGGTAGIRDVQLSSTTGSHVRTFTVADVTGSADPDLTVSVPITNGAATSGGLTKAGLGTLLLSASNTYTGPTNVLAGTLALENAAAVAGSSGLSIAAGARLDLSALGGGLSLGSGQSLGGAGSILGSIAFGSGSSLVFSTTDTLALSGGTASFFAGTPGSRFGIDDLIGLSSSTPLGAYTLITGTVDFTNLDNVGAGNAYDLGGGVSAYFQQGSLQVVVVPEPVGMAGWVLGLVMVGAVARRRRR